MELGTWKRTTGAAKIKARVEVSLDICEDSPTAFHHFILPTPNGDPVIVGVCKYCGDNKLHGTSDRVLGYNNQPKVRS